MLAAWCLGRRSYCALWLQPPLGVVRMLCRVFLCISVILGLERGGKSAWASGRGYLSIYLAAATSASHRQALAREPAAVNLKDSEM